MKRKPSSTELTTPLASSKEVMKRLKSPQNKRVLAKKAPEISSIMLPKHKVPRSREENKADSNNTTTSTKPKASKLKKVKKHAFEGLDNEGIMNIINSFATKIQRQWRVYIFRKHWKEVFGKDSKVKRENENEVWGLRFKNEKILQLVQLEEEISSGSMLYDRQKYDSFSSYKESNHSEKEKEEVSARSQSQKSLKASKSSSITPRSQNQSSSKIITPRNLISTDKQSKSIEKPQPLKEDDLSKEARRASFNAIEQRRASESRRHSTGQLPPKRVISDKQLQIGKAFDIVIEKAEKSQKIMNLESPSTRRVESQAAIAFKRGSSIDKMMNKCKKQLEITKLRQLLSVQNRYSKNQVTYRNYLEIVGKINQDHTCKLQEINFKEGRLKNALGQLIQVYKENRFAEDDPHSVSHLDVSLSFDRWDFNSSAKKSIDHLDFPEGNSSKVLSIESVLRELEQEESGAVNDEKRFRKNKSLQMIEVIAERSKQISERDIGSFEESPYNNVEGDVEAITIKEPEESIDNLQQQFEEDSKDNKQQEQRKNEEAPPSYRKDVQQQSIEQIPENTNYPSVDNISCKKSEDHAQEIPSSHSLLITSAGTNPLISSEDSIEGSHLPDLMKELVYKEIKTAPIDYQDRVIIKFRELVIEKILMTNIKFINSIKFSFAKAAEESKKSRAPLPQLPFISADINAVNSWLLEISHFVLDGYHQVLRENMFNVKQPPIGQILMMARRELTTNPPYETISEYVYKDFEFYYIKTLQKNYRVDDKDYDVFSSLLYTFHRTLIDALNEALMEELLTGKDWIRTPWKMPKKFRALRNDQDEVKLCLQRSINVVSNWCEYGLGRLILDDDFTVEEYQQFEEQKIKLVCREQILSQILNPTFVVGSLMLQLADFEFQRELEMAIDEILCLFKDRI